VIERNSSSPGGGGPYVFVCYAHDERALVLEQVEWLRRQGFEIWYDESIEGGSRWSEDLARAVEGCSAVLYFLSSRSAASRYCLDEIHFALECGRPIVPVELEPVMLTPGLRLSLGSTHRLFMHRMDAEEFREKLSRGLRAAMEGRLVQDVHGPAASEKQPVAPAVTPGFNWRPVVAGILVALAVFALIAM
jgi:hypothetical protein